VLFTRVSETLQRLQPAAAAAGRGSLRPAGARGLGWLESVTESHDGVIYKESQETLVAPAGIWSLGCKCRCRQCHACLSSHSKGCVRRPGGGARAGAR
jgi:hypothetical protein